MTTTEPLTQKNPVSPDGLLRWNGHDWEPNLVEEGDFGPEKLATLTEAERHHLASALRPDKLGWYADPLSDGSSARLWSGSEWTGIVRRKLESATSASGSPAAATGDAVPGASRPDPEKSDPQQHPPTRLEGRLDQRRSGEAAIPSTTPHVPRADGQRWSTDKKLPIALMLGIAIVMGIVAVGASSWTELGTGSQAGERTIATRDLDSARERKLAVENASDMWANMDAITQAKVCDEYVYGTSSQLRGWFMGEFEDRDDLSSELAWYEFHMLLNRQCA